MLVFPQLSGYFIMAESAQAGVGSIWPVTAAASALIGPLAEMAYCFGGGLV